jgi:hypothetical protein
MKLPKFLNPKRKSEMFTLGQRLRDRVSGFEGIATGRLQYLNGCVQYLLRPKIGADGKTIDGEWFDDQQIEFVDEGITVAPKRTGGPSINAPQTYRG